MIRTRISDLLARTDFGAEVCVKGWVRTKRGSKSVNFIALNDGVDTIHKNNEMLVILKNMMNDLYARDTSCLLYTSPSPRDVEESRMPSSA